LTIETTPPAENNRNGWFTSSYSNAGGSCVEARFDVGIAHVRDSKDRRADSPVIAFSPSAWTTFLHMVAPKNELHSEN
jgi:hypothetical protein